jgi:Uncharacterised nucleotidyltransferase
MGRERLDQSRARAIGTNLAADVVAAEVVPAFERRGIEVLVLRGPAIALWLYREGERDYGDVDLLVQAGSLAQAEQILESLGFEGDSLASASAGRRRHAEMWRRGSAPAVDLHRTIVGAEATDADVWRALRRHAAPITLNGVDVSTLDRVGLLVVVTLHAAQHGLEGATRDLAAALEQVGLEDWQRAAALAEEIDAVGAFAAGLRTQPNGATVAQQLRLDAPPRPETLLRARAAPDLSLGLNWAADLPSKRAQLRFVAAKTFPAPDAMRSRSPLARRGRRGLALAYVQRLAWLAVRTPRAVRAVRRARRAASERAQD